MKLFRNLLVALVATTTTSAFTAAPPLALRAAAAAAAAAVGTTTSALRSTDVNPETADIRFTKDVWNTVKPEIVQGKTLKTWSYSSDKINRAQVLLTTAGRPLNAVIELWEGPDNTPQQMSIYLEDGSQRPFNCIIETPRNQNAIKVRNTASMEYPLQAAVEIDSPEASLANVLQNLADNGVPVIVQGGSLKTFDFSPQVDSIQIFLRTDGRPMNAKLELLQAPNNPKQIIEIYTEDGLERPFFAVLESPGPVNVVRVINTAPLEYPLYATVEPYVVSPESGNPFTISGGDMVGM